MKELYLTTSWDDGHPKDVRLADLLSKHKISATFYVPIRNQEGKPVLSSAEKRTLDQQFELGCHTLDHMALDGTDKQVIQTQVEQGKSVLEDELGHEVDAFCYPGGRNTPLTREVVKSAGFKFARTTADFHTDLLKDPFLMPASVQFKPRSPMSFAYNYLKWGNWVRRAPMMLAGLRKKGLADQVNAMFQVAERQGGVFHLWGHSYHIEEFDGWDELDRFLSLIAERIPNENRLTNGEVFDRLMVQKENRVVQ